MKTKKFLPLFLLLLFVLILGACAPGAPAALPSVAPGEAPSAVEDYTTPHPILSDVRVRRAIAHCIDRDALIASVYPYVEDPSALLMDSFLPKTHWAYKGPYDFPWYDPEAGKALLEEAGWVQGDGPVRTNANGEALSLKFTTTSAAFRQTWSQVMIQNLAQCGIQIIPTYAPASWWFGDTTGLSRRDFELGAFAWVGQADPAGRTLYACDQIPLPSNNWEGQNYMGWCNPVASDAIIRANNTLIREERIAAYDIVQREFAKDVVSIPVFQRAEAQAWSSSLSGVRPDPTEYATANLHEWELADGGDTIVIGMTQEPDSMWALVSSMAAQRLVDRPGVGMLYTQYSYDFQPALQDPLSTLESGLATNDVVEVSAGDKVYDATGAPVELAAGVRVIDSEGNEVEYSGEGTVQMNQLTVTYKLKPATWSDGTPVSVEDMKLGVKIDCDPNSGATTFDLCNRIGDLENDITYSDSELAMTIKYLPGNQYPLYFLYPFGIYPSQRVLSDGRVLADVPAAEWATLPEVAERPLSVGPYYVKEWNKGQSIVLERNPYYEGEVKTPNVIFVFVADTNQAVAQLLNGDVDFLDPSTLGAGAEVQTVIDAAESTGNVQYYISGSPTWEHIDINLYTK
ncbi:ABC transporter substrate-binding protein [Caldilinea sp.]|uniref:ABC transporter substrate-binding protein n=1 Tax=Caldilinea sp. TaxID=2293560 RepID=UPI0021DF1257|nr:ABC transporter substrate-binding protein [Caldilinea sp.]GIV67262.1 MAG: peptide ABC transporter substrate-binding protein [Caldilinea sp.]